MIGTRVRRKHFNPDGTPGVELEGAVVAAGFGGPYHRYRVLVQKVDGLSREVIRERFARGMRDDFEPTFGPLTPAQLAWAREDWSAQLRAKVQASKERERNQIICEANYVDD